jgi:hypothetical protein
MMHCSKSQIYKVGATFFPSFCYFRITLQKYVDVHFLVTTMTTTTNKRPVSPSAILFHLKRSSIQIEWSCNPKVVAMNWTR